MSEAKFTKGAWNVKTTMCYSSCDKKCRHEVLVNDIAVTCLEDSIANAHLITAAPEMYHMLEALRLGCSPKKGELNKLLAKARGEL